MIKEAIVARLEELGFIVSEEGVFNSETLWIHDALASVGSSGVGWLAIEDSTATFGRYGGGGSRSFDLADPEALTRLEQIICYQVTKIRY